METMNLKFNPQTVMWECINNDMHGLVDVVFLPQINATVCIKKDCYKVVGYRWNQSTDEKGRVMLFPTLLLDNNIIHGEKLFLNRRVEQCPL
jgi:hypothetical protein